MLTRTPLHVKMTVHVNEHNHVIVGKRENRIISSPYLFPAETEAEVREVKPAAARTHSTLCRVADFHCSLIPFTY